MLRCFVLLASLVFGATGCATTAHYEKILDSWVGAHVDRLVTSWGPPQSSHRLSDGGHIIEYNRSRNIQNGRGHVHRAADDVSFGNCVPVWGRR
jgi:hypothetical protein